MFVRCLIVLILVTNFLLMAQEKYTGQRIQDILELPEEDIDLGLSTLILAKEFYPDMNVELFLDMFDYLSNRYHHFFGEHKEPEMRIRALNTFLYRPGIWNDSITFSYDTDDLHVAERKNRFINGYLSSKTGSCITMPMLYLILGERLGFPIYPVRSPKHFFVRYISDEPTISFHDNIEATNGGGYIPDIQYQSDAQIPDRAVENGVYLRTMTRKEYLATLLVINATEYVLANDLDKTKEYLQLAMKYDSTYSGAYWNYGILHLQAAKRLEALMNSEKRTELVTFQAVLVSKAGSDLTFIAPNQSEEQVLPSLDIALPSPKVNLMSNLVQGEDMASNSISKSGEASRQTHLENQTTLHSQAQQALQEALRKIEEKYVPLIKKNLEVYRKFSAYAEELGYVKEFPVEFFQKQSESLKQFQENGGY